MSVKIIEKERFFVIIRHHSGFDVLKLFSELTSVGVKAVEITLNTPKSLEMIELVRKNNSIDITVGVGTVLGIEDTESALSAGAQFIVSPIYNSEMIKYCVNRKVPVFPGAFTPTEIYKAYNDGASMVKLFPAAFLGPDYIKAIKGPLNNIKIIAVGGIRSSNVIEYFHKGADAVAVGGGIVKSTWIDNGDYGSIKRNLSEFIEVIRDK